MASITRTMAEKNITLAFTQYLDALSKARKNKEKLPPEAMPLFDGMDKFRSFVKSPDLQQKVFNRLSLQGIQELHNGCSILAELYALSCSASLKNMTVTEDSPAGMITSNAEHFSAGGSYLFNLENLGNRTKKPGEFLLPSWNCYRLDTVSGKYGLYKEGLSEQRALLDTDRSNRTFLFKEAGTYKITASIFKEGFSPVPELVEVREHVIQVFDDSDADIAGLPPEKKILLAVQYSSLRDTLKNIGLDVVAVAASIALFAGIAFVLNKLPAGKLRPFLLKIAKELGLAELMSFIGTAGDVFNFTALVASTCTFREQAVNAQNRKQLEDAGETFEKAAEALGLVLVFRGIDLIGRSLGRNTKAVEDRIRAENEECAATPAKLLADAGYSEKGSLAKNTKINSQIANIQHTVSTENLSALLSKTRTKISLDKTLDTVSGIIADTPDAETFIHAAAFSKDIMLIKNLSELSPAELKTALTFIPDSPQLNAIWLDAVDNPRAVIDPAAYSKVSASLKDRRGMISAPDAASIEKLLNSPLPDYTQEERAVMAKILRTEKTPNVGVRVEGADYANFLKDETKAQAFFSTPEEIAGVRDAELLMELLGFDSTAIANNMNTLRNGGVLYLDAVVAEDGMFQSVQWDDIKIRFMKYIGGLNSDDVEQFQNYYPDMFNSTGAIDPELLEKNYFSAYRTKEATNEGLNSLPKKQYNLFMDYLKDRFNINENFTGTKVTATVPLRIIGCSEMVMLNDGRNLPVKAGGTKYTTYRFSFDSNCNYKFVKKY